MHKTPKQQNDKILIYLPKLSDFHRSPDSATIFKPMNFINSNLIKLLNDLKKGKLREQVRVRMHKSDIKYQKIMKKYCGSKLIQSDIDQNLILSQSKLVIHTYLNTSFIDTMYNDIPSILFIKKLDPFNSFTIKILKELKKVNIVFNSEKKLSKFIESNFNNLEKWWFSKDILKIKKKYLNIYASNNPKLIKNICSF